MTRIVGARLAGVLVVIGGMGLTSVGSAAAAQPEERRRAPARERDGERPPPPLRGPAVRDEQPPGPGEGMTGEGGERRGGERIPLRTFLEAVRALEGEDAPEGVRATDEQLEKVRGLVEEFQQERRDYMTQHREEMQRLRAVAGEGQRRRGGGGPGGRGGPGEPGGPGRPDGAPPEMGEMDGERAAEGEPPADRRAAAQRLREIERAGPQPEALYRRIWAELSAEQRGAVERNLQRFRDDRARQREDAYVRQRVPGGPGPEGRPAPDGADRPMRRGPGPGGPDAAGAGGGERRERLLRVFNRLSPEEQEALLERLERRLGERGPAGGPPRGERPAPGMDGVDVPPEPGPAPERP